MDKNNEKQFHVYKLTRERHRTLLLIITHCSKHVNSCAIFSHTKNKYHVKGKLELYCAINYHAIGNLELYCAINTIILL